MHDTPRVRMRERRSDGRAVTSRLVPAELPPADERVQAVAVDELEHEHRLAAILEDVVEANDVRVLEPRERRGLTLETRAEVFVVRHPRVEHLEGHVTAESLVTRAPDDAHPAPPELLDEAVTAGDDVLGSLHVGVPSGLAGRSSTVVQSRLESVNAIH